MQEVVWEISRWSHNTKEVIWFMKACLFAVSTTINAVPLIILASCVQHPSDQNTGKLLVDAARVGEEPRVLVLLSDDVVNFADHEGVTALMAASEACHPRIVKLLLDGGADIHLTDRLGQQPLTKAAMFGCHEAASLLLDAGADSEGGDVDQATPLMWAATKGDSKMIRILVAAGAKIDADARGWTSLMFAIENGREEALQTLLDLGADPDRMAPLLLAPLKENGATFVRRLLAAGADPNIPDIDGITPLMAAADSGNVEAVLLLLDGGADPLALSKEGKTALDMAKTSEDSNERIIELLSARARQ